MTPGICPIGASTIRSARESLQSRLGEEIIKSVYILCSRPMGHVNKYVQEADRMEA